MADVIGHVVQPAHTIDRTFSK